MAYKIYKELRQKLKSYSILKYIKYTTSFIMYKIEDFLYINFFTILGTQLAIDLMYMAAKKPATFTINPKEQLDDIIGKQKLASSQSQKRMINLNKELFLLNKNSQKIDKRNLELMRLFKPTPHQQFNLQNLEKSQFMSNNQNFNYLVQCLKKQRQGMITFQTLSEEKAKDPKPIQNKIRQFLYNSLQQSLLMSQKQIQQTKFFQRLFQWFTDVFKERQMKLSFKKQSPATKDLYYEGQDWYIRNTYKSNMPFELDNYHRKMLSVNQLKGIPGRINAPQSTVNIRVQEGSYNQGHSYQSQIPNKFSNYDGKAFSQSANNLSIYKKTSSTLPVIDRRNLISNLTRKEQVIEKQQLQLMQSEWQKNRAQKDEHSVKNYYKRSYMQDKVLFGNSESTMKKRQSKSNSHQFKLNKNTSQRIQAAKFGVTVINVRKNKQNLDQLKNFSSYQPRVFHPCLTGNYFNDIKRKKLQKIRKDKSFDNYKYKLPQPQKMQDSQNSNDNIQQPKQQMQNQVNKFEFQNIRKLVEGIDGLGLTLNPFEKVGGATKKK